MNEAEFTHGPVATIGAGVRAAPALKSGLSLTLVLALIGSAGRVVGPVVVQQAIDRGMDIEGGLTVDTSFISRLCLIGLACLLLTGLAQRAAVKRLGHRSEEALFGLRSRLFEHVHRLSLEDHNDERRGALVARVTSDVETLSQFFSWGGFAFILNGALTIVVSAVMLSYDWILAVTAIVVSAPLYLVLRRVQRRLVAAYDAVRAANGRVLGTAGEIINGAETLFAYRCGPEFAGRVAEATAERRRAQTRASLIGAFLFPSGEVFGTLAISAVVIVGVWRGEAGGLTAGALVGFVFLTYRLLEPIAELTEVLDQTQTAIAGLRRVLGILAIPVGPLPPSDPIPLPRGPLDIVVDDVSFRYRPRGDEAEEAPALRNVDITIKAGTRVAIVGETGSGKTTLGRLLARFSDPTVGDVRIGGVSLRRIDNDELRRSVVVVPQEPFLFDDTIIANVGFARPGIGRDDVTACVDSLGLTDWVTSLTDGLDTQVGNRGSALSAGERQLVALIRAAVVDPPILVLDEATSSVDPGTEVSIARALDMLSRNRTTISIAHRLSTAARADRVIVLADGRVVQDGHHDRLVVQPGPYARMYADWIESTSVAESSSLTETDGRG